MKSLRTNDARTLAFVAAAAMHTPSLTGSCVMTTFCGGSNPGATGTRLAPTVAVESMRGTFLESAAGRIRRAIAAYFTAWERAMSTL